MGCILNDVLLDNHELLIHYHTAELSKAFY